MARKFSDQPWFLLMQREVRGVTITDGSLTNNPPCLLNFEQLQGYPLIVSLSRNVDDVLANYYERRAIVVVMVAFLAVSGLSFTARLHRAQQDQHQTAALLAGRRGRLAPGAVPYRCPGPAGHRERGLTPHPWRRAGPADPGWVLLRGSGAGAGGPDGLAGLTARGRAHAASRRWPRVAAQGAARRHRGRGRGAGLRWPALQVPARHRHGGPAGRRRVRDPPRGARQPAARGARGGPYRASHAGAVRPGRAQRVRHHQRRRDRADAGRRRACLAAGSDASRPTSSCPRPRARGATAAEWKRKKQALPSPRAGTPAGSAERPAPPAGPWPGRRRRRRRR